MRTMRCFTCVRKFTLSWVCNFGLCFRSPHHRYHVVRAIEVITDGVATRNRNFFPSGSVHRLGLGLVIAVWWWGASEVVGCGGGVWRSPLPSKKIYSSIASQQPVVASGKYHSPSSRPPPVACKNEKLMLKRDMFIWVLSYVRPLLRNRSAI